MAAKSPNTAEAHDADVRRTFEVVITQDEDGLMVGRVPNLPGCFTQGKTVAQVKQRIKEAILLSLADEDPTPARFVSVEKVTVEA